MVTKKSIDAQMAGESTQEVITAPSFIMPVDNNIKYENTSDFVIFVLKNWKGKGKYNLDGIDDVINPQTKKKERIWYIPGETSIWQSDLEERLKDKSVRITRKGFVFVHKRIRIHKTDTLALEFLKHHNANLDNPNRIPNTTKIQFEEYNPARIAAAALQKEMIEIQVIQKAMAAPMDKVRKHALYLGVSMADDVGFPKTEDGIRTEYILAAKRNPKLFNDTFESPAVEASYMIKRAISENKIDLGGIGGNIVWAGTNGFIAKKQGNKSAHEVLLELAMSNTDQGIAFKEQLKNIM